ncbi:MAG: hypothetical protein IKS85_06010 [Lachnospiraceae bacterium]|nr:hypothetical protein [Lachnospiraceae bacterium]
MNCKNCNAVMREDHERKVYVCPYCDSVEPFEGVSKAELQGMLRDAIVDVRKETLQEAKETLKNKAFVDDRSAGKKVLDVVILVMQIGFCMFLALFSIGVFTDFVGVGIVSLLQLGLMITAIILKGKARQTRSKKLLMIKNGCLIAVAVLAVIWVVALMHGGDDGNREREAEEEAWPKQGLASELPVLDGTINYSYSSADYFSIRLKKMSKAAYEEYVSECKEAGFNIDVTEDEYSFEAYNEADQKLKVYYYYSDKSISIDLNEAINFSTFRWPSGDFYHEIPIPEAEKSCVDNLSENTLRIYVGELTKEEFRQYVFDCRDQGFEGTYSDASDRYNGQKGNISLHLQFLRNKILYIELYKPKN